MGKIEFRILEKININSDCVLIMYRFFDKPIATYYLQKPCLNDRLWKKREN